jgi:DNA repair protein RAD57
MSDLLFAAPDFPTTSFSNIIPSLEKNHITVADLLTLDAVDIARRAQLPAREVRRLTEAVIQTLQDDLGLSNAPNGDAQLSQRRGSTLHSTGTELASGWSTISFLDDKLDAALGGGIPTGYITEIVGER